jgi:hypothetical protein
MRKLFEERERWPVAEMTELLTAAGHWVSTIKRVRQNTRFEASARSIRPAEPSVGRW